MTDSPPLPLPSWPFSIAKLCLIAQRSVAFWQPWISQVSRHCERSFKRILSREPLRPFHQAGFGIVWATTGSSSMSMAPNKQPDNEPFRLLQSFLLPIGVLSRYVLPDIWGANEEKWQGPEPRCSKPTHTTGWAASVALGMGITVANWHAHLRQSAAMRAGSVQQVEKRSPSTLMCKPEHRRARWRLSWGERMARNARLSTASPT